jgi:pimeloyl-ACP methyl ester carboxylesterase/DNA-binding CsgD family transcriptional regulator
VTLCHIEDGVQGKLRWYNYAYACLRRKIMEQQVRFCRSADNVRIAYATSGQGPPLVKAANYLTHLEHDWNSPVWRHWMQGLSETYQLIRYDARGSGLSDWNVTAYNMEAWVRDLEAVVDALDLDRFPLLGISQGASVCVAYAVKHPERVTRLVLYGGYARGRFHRDLDEQGRLEAEALINLIRIGWGRENPAFRQLFSTMLMPDGNPEQMASLNQLAQISATPENASTMERSFYHIDVRHLAPKVTAPTLVLHPRQDASIPVEESRLLASLIPGSRFVQLESRNHVLVEQEPAWGRFLAELRAFLGEGVTERVPLPSADVFPELTPQERVTLELIALGLDSQQIAERMVITPKTVRNYTSRIYMKLGVRNRGQAIVLAREAGFGKSTDRSL